MHVVPDRAAIRALLKSPGFTAAAVASLALAIALTTTTYSIVDAVRHPAVAARDPEHLYTVLGTGQGADRQYHPRELYTALRAQPDLFQSVAMASSSYGTVIANDKALFAAVEQVSANYFDVVGLPPYLGRPFNPSSADHPTDDGAIVGYPMWRRAYGGDRNLSQLSIVVGDRAYPIVGVLPPVMDDNEYQTNQVWLPLSRAAEERGEGVRWVYSLVRLKPGMTEPGLEQRLKTVVAPLRAQYGDFAGNPLRYSVRSMLPWPGRVTEIHEALVLAAVFVLLIASANVANLLVARVLARRREIAVRMALGASQRDIARFVLGEAAVLAVAGGAGGVLLSLWGMHVTEYDIGGQVNGLTGVVPHLSWRVAVFAVLTTVATVMFIASAAILRARSTNVNEAIKDGAGGAIQRRVSMYRWLVVAELALSLTVLMGAALLARAERAVRHYDFGYDPAHVVHARLDDPWPKLGDAAVANRYGAVLEGVRAVPGVRGAEWMSEQTPQREILTGDAGGAVLKQEFMRHYAVVSPGLLRLLGVRMIKGRDFEAGDAATGGVAIVDDSTAARLWSTLSPLAHSVKLGDEPTNAPFVRVIGVVPTVSLNFERDPDMLPPATIYVAGAAALGRSRTLVVRTGPDEGATIVAVQRYLRTAVPGLGAPVFRSWASDFNDELQTRQTTAFIFRLIGVFALLLSTVGLYGTLAYSGAQRTREFAMRIALGAQHYQVWKLVVDEALVLVLAGTAAGAFVAMWGAGAMRRLLYSVSPVDAASLVAAEAILLIVSLTAAMAPALRATRADPVDLLRAT